MSEIKNSFSIKLSGRFVASALLLSLLFLNIGCDNLFQVGLGETVDIEKPNLTIVGPPVDQTLKGKINLHGTATDDLKVSRVEVQEENPPGSGNYGEWKEADLTGPVDNREWTYPIDTATWPDGAIRLNIRAVDGNNKIHQVSDRKYSVDNGLPVILIDKPSDLQTTNTDGVSVQQQMNINVSDRFYPLPFIGVQVYSVSRDEEGEVRDYSNIVGSLGEEGDEIRLGDNVYALEVIDGEMTLLKKDASSSLQFLFEAGRFYQEEADDPYDDRRSAEFAFNFIAKDEGGSLSQGYYHIDDVRAANDSKDLTVKELDDRLDLSEDDEGYLSGLVVRRIQDGGGSNPLSLNFKEEMDVPWVKIPAFDVYSREDTKNVSNNELLLEGTISGQAMDDAEGLADYFPLMCVIPDDEYTNSADLPGGGVPGVTNPLSDANVQDFNDLQEFFTSINYSTDDFLDTTDPMADGSGWVSLREAASSSPSNKPKSFDFEWTPSSSGTYKVFYLTRDHFGGDGGPRPAPRIRMQEYNLMVTTVGIDLRVTNPMGELHVPPASTITLEGTAGFDGDKKPEKISLWYYDPEQNGGEYVEFTQQEYSAEEDDDTVWTQDGTTPPEWTFEFDLRDIPDGLSLTEDRLRLGVKTVNPKSPVQKITLIVDDEKPILTVTSPSENEGVATSSYTLRGTLTDDGGKGIDSFEYSLDYTDDGDDTNDIWEAIDPSFSWSVPDIDFSTGGEGPKSVWFRASDGLNDATEKEVNFFYDESSPTINETAIGTMDTEYTSDDSITISGELTDSNAIPAVDHPDIDGVTISATLDGTEITAPTVTYTPDDNDDGKAVWESTLDLFDSNGDLADGKYVFTITGRDVADKTDVIQRTVRRDTTAPEAAITSSIEEYYTSQISVKGSAGDVGESVSGVEKVEYQLQTGTTSADPEGSWTEVTGSSSWFSTIDLSGDDEGEYTLYVRATDRAGNENDPTSAAFTIDRENPVIEVDSSYDGTVYREGEFTIEGTVEDSLELDANPISVSVDGPSGDVTLGETGYELDYDDAATPPTWSQTVPIDDGDGNYTVTITATDNVGRTSEVERTVIVDTEPPTLPVNDINLESNDVINNTSYNVTGTSDDDGTGVEKVEYRVNDGTNWSDWADANGTNDWTVVLEGLTEGLGQTLELKATDRAERSVTESIVFRVDTGDPTITALNLVTDTEYRNDDFDITFTLADTHDLASYTVKRDDATILTDSGDDPVESKTISGTSQTITVNQLIDDLDEATYEYEITVTDTVGKTSSESRTVVADTQSPILEVTSPSENEGVGTSNYTLRGTLTDDGGKGIDSFEYSLDYTDDGDDTNDTWEAIDPSFSWSVPDIDFSDGGEGPKSVWFRASDGLNDPEVQGINFFYDTENPTLTEDSIGTTDTEYTSADSITISGTLNDSNELKDSGGVEITATLDGTAITPPAVTYTKTDGQNADWSSTPDLTEDGQYVFTITGKDVADKTHALQRNVRRDTTEPTVVLDTDLSGWKSNNSITLDGTAADPDNGSGVAAVEYRLNGGEWSLMTGTTSWTGGVGFDSGGNNLEIRARDRADNISTIIDKSVLIDTAAPTGDVTSPSDMVKVNGQNDLAVTLTAADTSNQTDNGSGVASVQLKAGDNDFSINFVDASLDSGNEHSGTWKAVIPASELDALSDGQRNIYVRIEDGVGRSTQFSFPVVVDKTPPDLEISSHTEHDVVNKSITVSGTASDTQGMDPDTPVEAHIWNTASSSWEAIEPVNGSFNWDFNLDTEVYDSADYDVGGASVPRIRLRLTARDEASNTKTVERELDADQNSDRPVVSLSNINVDGSSTLKLTRTIYGSISDDDGTVSSFEVSLNGTDYTTVNTSSGSWSYDIPSGQGDGDKELYFRVTDALGQTFVTTEASSLDKPRILVDDTPTYSETPVSFKLDTVTPELDSDIIVDRVSPLDFDADTEVLTTNMPFGGSKAAFDLRVLAKDANDIASVEVDVPGLTGTPFAAAKQAGDSADYGYASGYEVWDTSEAMDVSSLDDGTVDILITVTDNSGLTATATRTIVVDNTQPAITHNSPLQSEIVNGDIEVKGLAEDGGSGLDSVEYKIGYNYDSRSWQPVGGSLFSWQIDLTGSGKVDTYAGKQATVDSSLDLFDIPDHGFSDGEKAWVGAVSMPSGLDPAVTYYVVNATTDTFQLSASSGGTPVDFTTDGSGVRVSNASKDTDNDGIWDLPILIRAVDKASNVLETADTRYVLQVDPSGDIPNVGIIYPDPDDENRTLGGSIRIFGSADDDDGVSAVYMQIDVDGDGQFESNGDDVASNGVDWYNGGDGQLVDGTVSWNKTINSDGEFNPSVDGDTRTIYFRVRAKDINGLYGPWSAPQRIDVDKDVPKIGSSQPLTLVQGGTEQPYIADTWLKGDWSLTGSVEDDSGIDDITISGDISGSLSGNPGWFSGPDGDGNYTFEIPVTNASTDGRVSFTITALDNSTPQLSTSTVISVQGDNSAPVSNAYDGSTPVVQSNLAYTLESSLDEDGSGFGRVAFYMVRRDKGGDTTKDRVYMPMKDNEFTNLDELTEENGLYYKVGTAESRPDEYSLTDSGLIDNANVREGGLIRIAGMDRRIVDWDNSTGTVTWAETVDEGVTDYKVAYAMVVDNQTIETPEYSGDELINISNDDGDGMVEGVERSGGLYSWTASIDSKNIPDGPIEIHWVSYDKAGNYVTDSVTTSIANNRPLLAAVTLGTDLDGSDTVEEDEKESAYSALDGQGNEQQTATVESGDFVAKAKTSVDIDVVGGNGQLQYVFTNDGEDKHGGLNNLRIDDTEDETIETISIEESELGVDGAHNLVFDIWDSTEETTPGTDSLHAQLTVPITVDLIDEVQPNVAIDPFFWNSSTDNSLYENSKDNGHIEVTGVVDGEDPDVSGQISIRGTAYDDQRLTSLWMAIEDDTDTASFAFTGADASSDQFDTDEDGILETASQTYHRVATFSGGTWAGTDQWDTNGWKFSVTPDYLDQSGHKVEWQLDWDSSKVNGVAALNQVIKAIAVDKRGTRMNASSETEDSTAGDETYNVPALGMDVVPYISDVTNSNNLHGLSNDVIRSATGRYSIDKSSVDDNRIYVDGFNFNDTSLDVTLSGAAITDSTAGTSIAGQKAAAATSTRIELNKDFDDSGYITVFVDGVPSTNNLNTNDEDYHSEYDPVLPRSYQWDDDRFIHLWDVTQMLTGANDSTFYYPSMIMNGNQPVFSYTNDNDGSTRRTTGDTTSKELGALWYERQTSLARDSSGNYYTASVQDAFSGGSIGFLYVNRDRNESPGVGSPSGNLIELVGEDYVSRQLNRFRYPQLIVDGPAANARNYLAVYDAHPDEKDIKFFAFEMQDATTSNLTEPGWDDQIAGNGWVSIPGTQNGASSESFDMTKIGAATDDGHKIVVAYYDETAAALKIKFAVNPVDTNGLYDTGTTWNEITVEGTNSYAGTNVSATNDGSDVYLAYHDSANADLKVAKVPGTMLVDAGASGSVETYTVDSYLSTGTWTNITTIDGVPYVSYYSGSYNGTKSPIRMAYPLTATTALSDGVVLDGSDHYSGEWEVMAVPAESVPKGGMAQFNRTQIDQYTDGTNQPVLGWLGDRLEYAKLTPEAP